MLRSVSTPRAWIGLIALAALGLGVYWLLGSPPVEVGGRATDLPIPEPPAAAANAETPEVAFRPLRSAAFNSTVETTSRRADLGQLELVFRTDVGAPVPGVRATVEAETPSPPGGPATSGADGVVVFDLPPARYRWVRLGGPLTVMNPPHEERETWTEVRRGSGSGWTKSGRLPPPNVSGLFDVRAGYATRIEVVVDLGCRLLGQLPVAGPLVVGEPRSWSMVHLSRRTTRPGSSGPESDLRLDDHVDSKPVGVGGGFVFAGLAAGTYVLHAHWRTGDDFSFDRRIVDVAAGEARDVGLLSASGVPTPFEVVVEGGPTSGLAPVPGRDFVTLRLYNAEPSATDAESVATFFDAPVGVPLRLVGLAPGLWQVGAAHRPDWAEARGLVPKEHGVRFRAGEPAVYVFAPEPERASARLELRASESPKLYVCAVPVVGGNEIVQVVPETSWKAGVATLDIAAPPGDYELFVHGQRRSDRSPDAAAPANLCAHVRVKLPAAAPILVDLIRGATFGGTALDAAGAPLVGEAVAVGPKGRRSWIYTAVTDAQGRFQLQGLVRGFEYEALGLVGEIRLDGAGVLTKTSR
jgi:hypothetical protein